MVSAIRRAAFLGLVLAAGVAHAQDLPARREVPIHETILSDGAVRYSVPLTIAGAPVETMIDTGSFGLRALAAVVPDSRFQPDGVNRDYVYSGGARFHGALGTAEVGIGEGAPARSVRLQRITRVDCSEQRPNCPVLRIGPDHYRIGGDGLKDEGFSAILGLSLRAAGLPVAANNPLPALGITAWILELPTTPQAPGRLILEPTAEERAGFATVKLDRQFDPDQTGGSVPAWFDNRLPGCLTEGGGAAPFCAPTIVDTGQPAVIAISQRVTEGRSWPAGTEGTLTFTAGGRTIAMPFVVGSSPSARVRMEPARDGAGDKLVAGVLPFIGLDVLYDAREGLVGFRTRETP